MTYLDDRRPWILLILACAAVLRFWGLSAGIPYAIGADEPQVLNRAIAMMQTGDFNPHFFDYPGLYIYVQFVVAVVRFMTGALLGYWSALSQAGLPDFLLWGRAVTAAIGTATVFVLYQIALRWGRRQALLAAGLLAVMPMHVRESHFVLTDVPVTFFVALTALLALRASERPAMAPFALAGVAAGLAAATKYPGVLALVFPLGAIYLTTELARARLRAAGVVIGAASAAFLAGAPYTLLDLPGFLNGYANLMASYAGSTEPKWNTYLKHLRISMEWPAFIAMLAGCVVAAVRSVRGTGKLKWVLALAFPLLYFWFISQQALVYGRYLMPLVPFACLLAALAVVAFAGALRRWMHSRVAGVGAVAALTALTVLPPGIASVRFDMAIGQRGTPAVAHDWLARHVPPGSKIYYEGTDLSLAHMPYVAQHITQLGNRPYEFYAEGGVQYLVASSQRYAPSPKGAPAPDAKGEGYARLFALTEEVARFTPDAEHPGPELRVLKIRR